MFLSPPPFPILYIKNICLCITIPQGLAENIYICFLPSFIIISRFIMFFQPCVLNLVTLTLCSRTLTCLSVCPAVIVLSVHILKDRVLNGTACWRLGCRSTLKRATFLMIVEIISEHPSGTWDCCLGPFYSSCYHVRLIFVTE